MTDWHEEIIDESLSRELSSLCNLDPFIRLRTLIGTISAKKKVLQCYYDD